jgi:Zn-dependent protease with chaperone function
MHVAIYLPLVIPLLVAAVAGLIASRLPPKAATWLLTASALALALASSAVLGLLALSALIRLPVIDALGHLSGSAVASGDAVSVPVAVAGGALLTFTATAAGQAAWRRGSAIARAHRHASRLPGAGEIVVTEDAAADAYTIPGRPCRIVITQGMLRALSAGERDVLLAHERTHARNSHYLFTSVARLAAAANPLLRPVAAEVGYAIERWADEHAAAQTGDRALTARAIAHAALAASAAPPDRDAALTALGLITEEGEGRREGRHRKAHAHARAGPVPRRVAALLAPPAGLSLPLLAAAVLLVAVSGASALEAARNLHQLIELAQGQPG